MRTLRRHMRLIVALVLGGVIWSLSSLSPFDPVMRALIAVNGFFVAYLGLMLRLTVQSDASDLRRHAEANDEGSALILILAIAAVVISMSAIFLVLNRTTDALGEAVFALASAPLGWTLMQVLLAYRYAHMFYSPDPDAGLTFPDPKSSPGPVDFLYFSFTIGMTAQVSDVEVTTTAMRKVVLWHSVGSYFFNTVILALAVNAGLALTGS
jgi:uncharacterized membrane protein